MGQLNNIALRCKNFDASKKLNWAEIFSCGPGGGSGRLHNCGQIIKIVSESRA